MKLRNQTYSSYYIEEIDNWGDRRDGVSKFGDKIHDNYHFLFPDNQDLSQALFGKDKFTAIIAEFDLTKHISVVHEKRMRWLWTGSLQQHV